LRAIGAARDKAARKLASLAAEATRAAAAEQWKTSGELIYAHLWQITPGQTSLEIDGTKIDLDPALSATENAQAYFERYRKARGAEAHLPALEAASQTEIAYLDQLATQVAQAPGFAELEALAAEWRDLQSPQSGTSPRRKKAPGRPRPLHDAEGNTVFVGRSGPQNDLVTFDVAGPDDTWLHARGVAGSHVVIRWRMQGGSENPATVEAAAALAAWYSAARESSGVEVDVARRRHVRKIKGAGPGMVTYRHERTLRVQPAPEERLRDVLTES
jgi:predicted ribosome quality control (RQC) complex YloA/Tae2 family protein